MRTSDAPFPARRNLSSETKLKQLDIDDNGLQRGQETSAQLNREP